MEKRILGVFITLLAILSTVFVACETDSSTTESSEESVMINSIPSKSTHDVDGKLLIGYFDDNDDFIFITNQTNLINNLNYNLDLIHRINSSYTKLDVYKDNGTVFIQASGTSNYKSTISMSLSSGGSFIADGISCTSQTCSTTNGCIPKADKKSCTGCTLNDCTKTVTAVSMLDKTLKLSDVE
ncbi:hypothetical protein [Flavobacterium litorale]|uniref:Lipoprotein n=1 Tax=Flavobacterium litorale TaxID=2856519 RepID=A0ABX8V4I2_9FLAO|nr:hypothetical protein [Flavobacterium litorale]QYJ67662.1 hypothetical protein K1I41_08900 [Flavobacterium litorale]